MNDEGELEALTNSEWSAVGKAMSLPIILYQFMSDYCRMHSQSNCGPA